MAATGNSLLGKGTEHPSRYTCCVVHYLGMANIHRVRTSFLKLHELLLRRCEQSEHSMRDVRYRGVGHDTGGVNTIPLLCGASSGDEQHTSGPHLLSKCFRAGALLVTPPSTTRSPSQALPRFSSCSRRDSMAASPLLSSPRRNRHRRRYPLPPALGFGPLLGWLGQDYAGEYAALREGFGSLEVESSEWTIDSRRRSVLIHCSDGWDRTMPVSTLAVKEGFGSLEVGSIEWAIHSCRRSVLVHCSDGWDRTMQVIAVNCGKGGGR
jgi:hypothetical protein